MAQPLCTSEYFKINNVLKLIDIFIYMDSRLVPYLWSCLYSQAMNHKVRNQPINMDFRITLR